MITETKTSQQNPRVSNINMFTLLRTVCVATVYENRKKHKSVPRTHEELSPVILVSEQSSTNFMTQNVKMCLLAAAEPI